MTATQRRNLMSALHAQYTWAGVHEAPRLYNLNHRISDIYYACVELQDEEPWVSWSALIEMVEEGY